MRRVPPEQTLWWSARLSRREVSQASCGRWRSPCGARGPPGDAGRPGADRPDGARDLGRSEEHTSELQSRLHLVCRLLLEKKKTRKVQALLLERHLHCRVREAQ